MKPTCLLCDGRHWYSEPCVESEPASIVRHLANKRPELDKPLTNGECSHCGQDLNITDEYNRIYDLYVTLRDKPPFDKKSYQREYMRRRRAGDMT